MLERFKQGKLKRKEKYTKLERKYNIKQKGEKVVKSASKICKVEKV